jgi:hypothetical protein
MVVNKAASLSVGVVPEKSASVMWPTDESCDFFISVTLSFRVLYVFVAMEIGSRRILDCNVAAHPTAELTIQQFREFSRTCVPTGLSFTIAIRSFRLRST